MNVRQLLTFSRSHPSLMYFFFPLMFQMLLRAMNYYSFMDETMDRLKARMFPPPTDDTFDFIVVGAGSSGSVVASRLSEHFKVLLLEAGGKANPFTNIPLLAFLLYGKIPEDWKYKTVPQKYSSFGLKDNMMAWPSGKGLGGSGLIHGMIYIRGTVQGFDIIANKTNDQLWSTENVLKYYHRIENYNGHYEGQGGHGSGGRLSAGKGYLSDFIDNFLRAGQELGYPITDPNPYGPVKEGFSPMDLYIKDNRRWSTWNGYIMPYIDSRQNFVVRKYSYGYKVLFDSQNRAIGVEYLHHGTVRKAYARREVILSTGSIQSAKILMLSGIGPKSELDRLNIETRVDLPVGQNLQDKYGAFVGPFTFTKGDSITVLNTFTIPKMLNWLIFKSGALGTSATEGTYTIASQTAKAEGTGHTPDIHTYILSLPTDTFVESILFEGSFNFKPENIRKYFTHASGQHGFMQLVNLAKPIATGTIKLQDSNPTSPILIDPQYLNNERDLKILIEAVKFAVKLVEETKSFQEINAKLIQTPFPGCEHVPYKSDEYWECFVRHTTATAYKYGGTAPLGKDQNDPEAVVDSRLRVFGVKNLRVIDGSVLFEKYVSVNHVTCVMLGELASDFILEEYNISLSNS